MAEKSRKTRKSKWTEEQIFKVINEFIVTHNKLPSTKELSKYPNLPTHSSIKNRFDMNVIEFYKTYYNDKLYLCKSNVYHYRSKDYWFEDFKKQYGKMNSPTMEQYDKNRKSSTPCAAHLLKILEIKSWKELIDIINNNNNKYDIRYTFSNELDDTLLEEKIKYISSFF